MVSIRSDPVARRFEFIWTRQRLRNEFRTRWWVCRGGCSGSKPCLYGVSERHNSGARQYAHREILTRLAAMVKCWGLDRLDHRRCDIRCFARWFHARAVCTPGAHAGIRSAKGGSTTGGGSRPARAPSGDQLPLGHSGESRERSRSASSACTWGSTNSATARSIRSLCSASSAQIRLPTSAA